MKMSNLETRIADLEDDELDVDDESRDDVDLAIEDSRRLKFDFG